MITTDASNMLLLKQICEAFKHQNTHYLQHPQVVEGLNEQEIQRDVRKCVRLGNDVLVRAITKAGERSVDVYLP